MLVSQVLASPKCIPISCVMDLLHHTNMENLSSAHVHLADSYARLGMDPMPDPAAAQNRPVPRNRATKAQSPDLRRNGSQHWIAKFKDFSTIHALLPFPGRQHFVHYQALGYSHGNETVLPKQVCHWRPYPTVGLLIISNSKIIVLCLRAAIIELS